MTSNPALTQVDTRDVVYTIERVAALFHVKVDTAREYTYRKDFPQAYRLGARLLWDRDEILVWFRALPASPSQTASP
jgi:predicted DNA-binding transcriptional regulator AlpA